MYTFGSIILFLIIFQKINYSLSESPSNIHVMKDEIAKALENCGDSKDHKYGVEEEFSKKVSIVRSKRQINIRNKALKDKAFDASNSEEDYDYGDYYKKSTNNQRNNKSRNDDKYSQSRYGTNDNNSKTWQNQNNTGNGQFGNNNNFDSRGGRYSPNFNNGKEYRSIRDLNYTANLYDPYMTRGIRSTDLIKRQKRFDQLVKNLNDNECLSQCVFTNLQIIDERGIPRESLFMKYIQEHNSSQQSRIILERQIQACFKELASESEENSCSYSNALDRCMDLQLKKRKSLSNDSVTNLKEI